MAPDGRPKAAMYENKWIYQPAVSTLESGNSIKIHNRQVVQNLSDFIPVIKILENGVVIKTEVLKPLDIPAGSDFVLNVKKYLPKLKNGSEYYLNIEFQLAKTEFWANKGYAVSQDQFLLQKGENITISSKGTAQLTENDANYKISGTDFDITIDKKNGALSSYLFKKEEQVLAPLLPNFTRPMTDNDRKGWKPNKVLKQWYTAVPKLKNISSEATENQIKISSDYEIVKDSASVRVDYLVLANGTIQVDYQLKIQKPLPNIPKVGMQMGVPKAFNQISWYGKGELENYWDRSFGFTVGRYSLPIDKFIEPYVKPQENGNRMEVRWMALSTSNKNEGLLVAHKDQLLQTSAWPFTQENLNAAKRTYELEDPGYITLNIDVLQMGVGGNDSWSPVAAPLEQYQIKAKDYNYSFYLIPFAEAKNGLETSLKKFN